MRGRGGQAYGGGAQHDFSGSPPLAADPQVTRTIASRKRSEATARTQPGRPDPQEPDAVNGNVRREAAAESAAGRAIVSMGGIDAGDALEEAEGAFWGMLGWVGVGDQLRRLLRTGSWMGEVKD